MSEKVKMMMNMAWAIAKINNTDVERFDLQKVHLGKNGAFDHYVLYAWYSDKKQVTIRQDCTIVEE